MNFEKKQPIIQNNYLVYVVIFQFKRFRLFSLDKYFVCKFFTLSTFLEIFGACERYLEFVVDKYFLAQKKNLSLLNVIVT